MALRVGPRGGGQLLTKGTDVKTVLARLHVSNLAIVEEATVAFGGGLNIITGETGAGKSVLMGALELVLGARADASHVRDGAKEARLAAEFELKDTRAVDAFLEEHGLNACEDGLLVVRRQLSAAGGGRVWINDAATTVQTLRALGRLLVDVHGPNDNQSLADEAFQRTLLDLYGKIVPGAYQEAWRHLTDLRAERTRLDAVDTAGVAELSERLRYAVDEIDAAALAPEDETELPARHAALAHTADILSSAGAVTAALAGEEETSAAGALHAAAGHLAEMARYHAPARDWLAELEEVTLRVQELARTVEDSVSRLEADPAALAAADERLTLVERLKRKYAPTVEAILALREEKAARLAELEGREARLRALDGEIAAAEKRVEAAGAALTRLRQKAALKLAAAVTRELRALGFLKAGFSVNLTPCPPEATGCDRVDYLFAPNPGEAARALREIASTGEIARVMLAIKTVTAAEDAIPVLVFDEIDSNIGGETGRQVGERLRAIARHHQVIAITHLAQSAVYGARHLAVSKAVSGGRTRSRIAVLEGEARVAEIARMLGGAKLTSVVEQHARELLALSREA